MSLTFFSDTTEVHDRYPTFTGSLAFDIGANGGHLAALLATNFETVVACEPHQASYGRLVADAPPNVRPLNIAISATEGWTDLQVRTVSTRVGELFTPGFRLPGWGDVVHTVTLPTTTLDALTAEYGQPDFVKIDTEGHEMFVLDGGRETFAKAPEFLIEVHSETSGIAAQNYLLDMGLPFEIIRHQSYRVNGTRYNAHYWLVSPT